MKKYPFSIHFIAVEGCVGSGKTTLARLLGRKKKSRVLLEATRKHPFIRDFYQKPKEYAFQTEMNFILIHYHQLQKAKLNNWFKGIVVSDFLFDKDMLFANLTLKKNKMQFNLFKKTFSYLKARIPNPDLVFYLKAPTDFLYNRIKQRGRDFERDISFESLDALNKEYHKLFKKYPRNKKIILNIAELDWRIDKSISKEKVIEHILNLIKRKYKVKLNN